MLRTTLGVLSPVLSLFLSSYCYSEVVSSGSSCHAITPAQASKMEWRAQGMVNTDRQTDWWVNCPFTRTRGFDEQRLTLRVFNSGNTSKAIGCNFREMYNGERIQGSPVSATIPAGQARDLQWTAFPSRGESVFNAACELPEGLQIEAAIARVGNCQQKSAQGTWLVAGGYGYDGAELAVVQFDGRGNLSGEASSTEGESSVYGRYTIEENCLLDVDVTIETTGVRLNLLGVMGYERNSLTGIGVNTSTGFFWEATMLRIGPYDDVSEGAGISSTESDRQQRPLDSQAVGSHLDSFRGLFR